MVLNHMALVCHNEKNSDRFYMGVLGLNRLESKILPKPLSEEIFNIELEFKIINYGSENIKLEIFINERFKLPTIQINHICVEVENRQGFIEKCNLKGVETTLIPKGESQLLFIKDYDGNMFEIREKK